MSKEEILQKDWKFVKHLQICIMKQNVEHVVFDFGVTKFMDSSGIGLIMGRYKKITCFGGKVFVLHPDKQIKRMLLMAGMDRLVEIVE